MRKLDFQTGFLTAAILFAVLAVGYALLPDANGQPARSPNMSELQLGDIPFNGQRAFEYLEQICKLGPRPTGSVGMQRQQELLVKHFESLGATVTGQSFTQRHPETGTPTTLTNLIVQWHPDRRERILLCAHYDTRPYPDRDPDRSKRRGVFLGANDGASGVALLMELGNAMSQLPTAYGVDFVFFDAEEWIYDDRRDKYFLGSIHFAQNYVSNPPDYRYKYGVLLDMVADKNLNILQERNSLSWPETRQLVHDIWRTAGQLGVKEFIARPGQRIDDDHIPLNSIARIPTCDIIDFDYPTANRFQSYWHTTKDVPANCSPLSLAKVGWVIQTWLQTGTK